MATEPNAMFDGATAVANTNEEFWKLWSDAFKTPAGAKRRPKGTPEDIKTAKALVSRHPHLQMVLRDNPSTNPNIWALAGKNGQYTALTTECEGLWLMYQMGRVLVCIGVGDAADRGMQAMVAHISGHIEAAAAKKAAKKAAKAADLQAVTASATAEAGSGPKKAQPRHKTSRGRGKHSGRGKHKNAAKPLGEVATFRRKKTRHKPT